MNFTKLISRILYPGRCVICDEVQPQRLLSDSPGICPECEKKLHRVKQPLCMRCGKPLEENAYRREYCSDCSRKQHYFEQGRAVFIYQGAIVNSMYRLKYSNRRDYAAVFAREAYAVWGAWIRRIAPDAMIPIPLHKNRRRIRGYNQAELIGRELSRLTGIPLYHNLLFRIVDTNPQKQLNDKERKNNLKKAFQTSKNIVQLEKVLLVDDIYTTGSTVDSAAEALMSAGIKKVYVLCICIGGGQ